jgi:hypothetical protein
MADELAARGNGFAVRERLFIALDRRLSLVTWMAGLNLALTLVHTWLVFSR